MGKKKKSSLCVPGDNLCQLQALMEWYLMLYLITAYPDSIFASQHAEQKLQLFDSDAVAGKNPQHIN